MADDMIIRRMTLDDVDDVWSIDQACFARPWPRSSYENEIRENKCARYLVCVADGKVVGFAGGWVVLDESQVTNIAILEAYRGRGYGKQLTQALLQYFSNLGAAISEHVMSMNRSAFSVLDAGRSITRIMGRMRSCFCAIICRMQILNLKRKKHSISAKNNKTAGTEPGFYALKQKNAGQCPAKQKSDIPGHITVRILKHGDMAFCYGNQILHDGIQILLAHEKRKCYSSCEFGREKLDRHGLNIVLDTIPLTV